MRDYRCLADYFAFSEQLSRFGHCIRAGLTGGRSEFLGQFLIVGDQLADPLDQRFGRNLQHSRQFIDNVSGLFEMVGESRAGQRRNPANSGGYALLLDDLEAAYRAKSVNVRAAAVVRKMNEGLDMIFRLEGGEAEHGQGARDRDGAWYRKMMGAEGRGGGRLDQIVADRLEDLATHADYRDYDMPPDCRGLPQMRGV